MQIISLTSHGNRLLHVGKTLFRNHLLTSNDYKVVLTLYKSDVALMPADLRLLIDTGKIELIIAEEDLGPHLKYFYAMQKYRNYPIITIDDDRIYPDLNLLIEAHKNFPDKIIGNCCIEMTFKNNHVNSLDNWRRKRCEASLKLMAEGFAGVLYPANILQLSDDLIPEILQAKYDDDTFLKMHEIRLGISVHATNSSTIRRRRFRIRICKNR